MLGQQGPAEHGQDGRNQAMTTVAGTSPTTDPPQDQDMIGDVAVVVIGRNEGDRLKRCLASLPDPRRAVYIDSGSTDGSIDAASAAGATALPLSKPPAYSAARARNTGLDWLARQAAPPTFAMLVDGDCALQPGFIAAARAALEADPGLALVFGRRRERFPDRSIYNALCDDEWNVPVGEAPACGGDVFCRFDAIRSIGGYRETMIAGEDPDMACRLRAAGWRLRRIDAEMTLHDAAILRFGQWWQRTRRSGHAYAELASLHPDLRAPDWRRQCRSILIWGAAFPALFVATLAGGMLGPSILLAITAAIVALWLLQIGRLTLKRRDLPPRIAIANAVLLVLGKLPQAIGMVEYHRNRRAGGRSTLIEYKQAGQ